MWTDGLLEWFTTSGRHELPWRQTTDPWAVLVSEVMLQQTSVSRVLPRWERFLRRWPEAGACAAEPLDAVLREWQGLGYPRRARWLWLTAARVTSSGWPTDEAGLRALPGVGAYTARALLAFSDLGQTTCTEALPPRDVNIGRVAARAALGREPWEVAAAVLDGVVRDAQPSAMPVREYAYALFDVGALHCRATPRCPGCALSSGCAFRSGGIRAVRHRPAAPYRGSLRQLRGAILAAALADPQAERSSLLEAVRSLPGATPERCEDAWGGLVADGLLGNSKSPR